MERIITKDEALEAIQKAINNEGYDMSNTLDEAIDYIKQEDALKKSLKTTFNVEKLNTTTELICGDALNDHVKLFNITTKIINTNTWLFCGEPMTGKTTLAEIVAKDNNDIEYYDINTIYQFKKIEATRVRSVKYSNKKQIMTFIYICIKPEVAHQIRNYFKENA